MPSCAYYEKKRDTGLYTPCTKRRCNEHTILQKYVCEKHRKLLQGQLDKHGYCDFGEEKFLAQQGKLNAPIPTQQQQVQPMLLDVHEEEPINNNNITNSSNNIERPTPIEWEISAQGFAALKRCAEIPLTPKNGKGEPIEPKKPTKAVKPTIPVKVTKPKVDIPPQEEEPNEEQPIDMLAQEEPIDNRGNFKERISQNFVL